MINVIENELENWHNQKVAWIQSEGRSDTYLNLNVIPYENLIDGNYNNLNGYDLLLPPLQVLGNIDEFSANKLIIISLEPLKTSRDLNIQNEYFFGISNENYLEIFGLHPLILENYYSYQFNYFNIFPQIIGASSPHSRGSNKYWRYIDCLANGYLGNNNLRSNDWSSLINSVIDIPIIPLWAKNHPGFQINNSIRNLFIKKINILKPKKILVLGKSKMNLIMELMELNHDEHHVNTIQNGNYSIFIFQKQYDWGECKVFFRRFFSNGGGSYNDAFQAGQIISE